MAGRLRLFSGPPNIRVYPEGATQTFVEGDLVKFSSGSVIIATDGTGNVGVAAEAASGTTADPVRVFEITPEQIWSVYTSGTPAAATHVGNDYDFSSFTTNTTVLALGSAGTDVNLVNLHPGDTPASGSRVLVRFAAAACWNWYHA